MYNVLQVSDLQCFGCGVCSLACHTKAIQISPNQDGYYKRHIDTSLCINCGKCLSVCPSTSSAPPFKYSPAYVAYCKNTEDVLKSSSGGIAFAIAKTYLALGYTIIGATWSRDFRRVEHIVIATESQLDCLRKSKYVQSYTVDAFSAISALKNVVVFGTPCQIAGLRKLYPNRGDLLLIDFECMGPSGLLMWHKYLTHLYSINSSGIQSIQMRNKRKSWMRYGIQIVFQDGETYYNDKFHDPFCILYHFGKMIQPTCLEKCPYLLSSDADLRIADAWNYTDSFEKIEVRNGLSLITPQTEKGVDILTEIHDQLVIHRVTQNISHTAFTHQTQPELWDSLHKPDKSILDVINLYNSVPLTKRFLRNISYFLSSNDTIYLSIKKLLRILRILKSK